MEIFRRVRSAFSSLAFWLVALATPMTLAPGGVALAQPLTLEMIQRNPAPYDRHIVVLTGSIGFVEGGGATTSMGMTGQAFTLIDGGMTIRVIGLLPSGARTGDRVEVEGTYSMARNLVEAIRVTPR